MQPKVVILGSSGFLGKALFQYLYGSTDLSVRGFNSSTLDLTSPDCVDILCREATDGTILIVTARSRVGEDPHESFSADILIATNIARCLSRRRVKKCIYFSSLSVYGDSSTSLAITEDTPIAANSLYGVAKFAGECVLRQAAQRRGTPMITLRPCMVYGPGDTSQAYGPTRFIKAILEQGKVSVFGDGSEVRDYLFIRDLVRITGRLIFGDYEGTYNLATGHSHSFHEILSCLEKVATRSFRVIPEDRKMPKTDQRIDSRKLLAIIPGFPFVELEEGLGESYKYFSTLLQGA